MAENINKNEGVINIDTSHPTFANQLLILSYIGGFQIMPMEDVPAAHWVKFELDRFRLVERELIGDYDLINCSQIITPQAYSYRTV
jgi:hypothetical protein